MRYKEFNRDERNKELIAYKKRNPGLSLEEIGEKFGITKQRVSQILNKNGRKNN